MKSIATNDNRRVKQTILRRFKRVAIFRDKHYVTLLAFVILTSQFLENDMFSIEMHSRMLFRSSKGLEKH